MLPIDALLTQLYEQGGSDLHLAPGRAPRARVLGALCPMGSQETPDAESLRRALREITPNRAWTELTEQLDCDFAYAVPGVGRFRVNLFHQATGLAAVFRMVPQSVASLATLNLPPAVGELAELAEGLVLVAGPTGSGKSTTLAAIVDTINRESSRHIVTIEDPIEFVHQSRGSVISHRQIGAHCPSFSAAALDALRVDADVLLIGELRDAKTLEVALQAAEGGALVLCTIHGTSVAHALDRAVDLFPSDRRDHVLRALADTLQAVLAQRLLRSSDGRSRKAAVEVLLRSAALSNMIRDGKTSHLPMAIQAGRAAGMQTMDDALFKLVQQREILPMDAYRQATDKARFEPLVRGSRRGRS